jgi:DNA polymerase-3 subunit epsilon
MKLMKPLIVLDIETTGTWVDKDKITEIALIKVLPDGTQTNYLKRFNPGMPIPKAVTELTGISDSDVKDAPRFRDAAKEILDFIGDAGFAGYNLERFDLPVIEREMNEAGLRFSWDGREVYDAQKVYHVNEKRDLTAAYRFYCGKEIQNAHSAMGDVEATLAILEAQSEKYGNGTVESLGVFKYERPRDFFDEQRRFRWWNGELYPVFGKYAKKMSIRQLASHDKGYLYWILDNVDLSNEARSMLAGALEGRFPQNEA